MKRRYRPDKILLPAFYLLAMILISAESWSQIAEDKCKFLGNIISGSAPSDFLTYWNQVSPENAGKWGQAEPVRNDMRWAGLDIAYNYAKTNNIPFKQHTFVWGQQQPNWLSALSAEDQKKEVEEWIKSFCERYPQTDYIDVVNEPLHAVPAYSTALGGGGTTGLDWIIWTFEKARQYCPNAKLALNDYNIISNDGATNQYLVIINALKARNLIDIIGEQGHFLETTPLITIKNNLDKLHATGLPIHISEYDVNIADPTEQKNKYEEQFPTLWTHPGVQGITLWGYKQGAIWRENAYLITSGGAERPALTWLKSYIPSVGGGSFCLPVTDVEDGDGSGIKVYPIPAIDGNFKIESGAGKFDVRVRDLQGSLKMEMQVSANGPVDVQLPVSAGVYILEVSDGKHHTFKKILVTR